MTISDYNILIDKAKTRKDGVYSYQTYLYVVKNNHFIAFADYSGNCYACHGVFTQGIGKVERYDRKKKLSDYLRYV